MSMSLAVLLPLILLSIVAMLCFTGCGLSTHGLGNGTDEPFGEYTSRILANPALLVYWPLSDPPVDGNDPTQAIELQSNIPGNYIDPVTAPELYPWQSYNVQSPPNPVAISDAALGKISFANASIVVGDKHHSDDNFPTPACIQVEGCYVEVPWNNGFVPQSSFTVEAWVRADWAAGDPSAWRFVVDARDLNPGAGFALLAKPDDTQPGKYNWAGIVGNGGSGPAGFTVITGDAITLGTGVPVYLALTYEAMTQTFTLFVNPLTEQSGTAMGSVSYLANTNPMRPLWIGAGAPYVPKRVQGQPYDPDMPFAPLFPFFGAIQDVAVYNKALAATDLITHFHNGSGLDP